MKKLNLGCGADIKKGFDNLDFVKNPGVDLVCDLNKFPYPIKDNTYDEIYARFILEHVNDFVEVTSELHRILKPRGKLIVEVPYDASYSTWSNFQHKRGFNLKTFAMFVPSEMKRRKIKTHDYGLKFSFSNIKQKLWFPKGFHLESYIVEPIFNLIQRIYEETMLRALFPAYSIIVKLTK
jgi:ubiquinone/menaquinone biosynthesis C-methylase UbiE